MESKRVIIVGAGAAGSAAAETIHRSFPEVNVVVVGAEDRKPYNRTTVNKGLLSAAVDDSDIALPGFDGEGIDWRTGCTATSFDPQILTVGLQGGATLSGDAVILATGASPRALKAHIDGPASARVISLRTAEDTYRLREVLGSKPNARVVIAGAGLIGTETAGILLDAGCRVVLTDPGLCPLGRRLGVTVAEWVAEKHRVAGIDLRTGTTICAVKVDGEDLRVEFDDGSGIGCDVVVVAAGVVPAVEWLDGSGLPGQGDGLAVDSSQRVVGTPRVYAAGDLASLPGPEGSRMRVEHWGAAVQQGRTAGAAVLTDLGLGDTAPANDPVQLVPVPAYSSYVHGIKLTILGWPAKAVTEHPILGSPGDPRFAVGLFDTEDRIVGAVGVGGARAVNQLRDQIQRWAPFRELSLLPTVPEYQHAAGPA